MKQFLLFCVLALSAPTLSYAQTTLIVNSNLDDGNARDANPGDNVCEDNNGRCTLRAAIDEANALSGDVTIVIPGRLPMGVVGTYTLSRVAPNMMSNTYEDNNEFGDLDLNGSFATLTLQGTGTPGPKITISPNDRILDVGSGKTVNLERLWLTGGTARAGNNGNGDGSGPTGVDGEDGQDGGALFVGENATVNIDQVSFTSNATQSGGNGATPASSIDRTKGGDAGDGGDGGAVYISTGATVNVNRSTFYQNGTGDAGGAAAGQASGPADGGDGGDGGSGGAIYNAGTLTIKNSTINANTNGASGSGEGGVNGGADGAVGEGGNGGGIANAQSVDGSLTDQGTLTLENTIVAGNTAGDDTDNGTQPGTDLFDASSGSTITLNGSNIIGINDAVDNLTGDLIGTLMTAVDPIITGLNNNADEAVPTLALGSGSPAIDAGSSTTDNDYDAKGFVRPAEGTSADIGATETNSVPTPVDLRIVELDVNNSSGSGEFVEIKNAGVYPVQMDDFVLVGFGTSSTSCAAINLYGELQAGELFTVADDGVANRDQMFSFDMPTDNCGSDAANQFANESGAVGLYKGRATNFGGFEAGSRSGERQDVIVYDNSESNSPAGRSMMDLCGAFGLSSDCAGYDGGDNQSIQVSDDGTTSTGTPSPGEQNSGALPVVWGTIRATSPKAGVVDLNWSSEYEAFSAGFFIEQTTPNGWADAGWVDGKGNSPVGHSYAHRLENVASGTHVFRLRQVDLDGSESFSPLVTVDVSAPSALSVFPNPARDWLTVRLPEGSADVVPVVLRNGLGQPVLTRSVGADATELPLTDLRPGLYYLTVVVNGETVTQPVQVR